MTQDCHAVKDKLELPRRSTLQPAPHTRTSNLIAHIAIQKPDIAEQEIEPHGITDRLTHESQSREDEIIYDGDTNIITERDAPSQLVSKLESTTP